MTPLQKSIAEIEAEIEQSANSEEATGLMSAIRILTANLEYERDVIVDAYQQGHDDACDGNAGQKKDFTSGNDYYTKTYNNERKN